MGFAISLKATNDTAAPIRALWDQVARFEATGSMSALDYPPHITLAVYDDIEPARVKAAAAGTFADAAVVSLTFSRLACFEAEPLVIWAAPSISPALTELHQAVHSCIDPGRCRPYYRPGAWIPHCTLGTQIRPDRRAEAMAFAARPIRPFEVVFDVADCVSFPPVLVLEEHWLARQA